MTNCAKPIGVAIVGCGLIGTKRAAVLAEDDETRLVAVADVTADRAERLAQQYGCEAFTDWQSLIQREEVEVVIVSTSNNWLASVTIEAARNGKHVLCEKPMGRDVGEARQMLQAARANRTFLKIGFNHRYHPAIRKAHELVQNGGIGNPYYIRCVYGHGGRLGYEKDWRANRNLSGGGEMLDQGIHLVDLCRWFFGDFKEVSAFTAAYFWRGSVDNLLSDTSDDASTPVEDNAFALMRTVDGRIALLHASWTQWKNRFTFEVYGDAGHVSIDGLNGSYGLEQVTWGRRSPESGPPIQECFEFPGPDRSWHAEWSDFLFSLRTNSEPTVSGSDGLEAMRMVAAVYEASKNRQIVSLDDHSQFQF